MPPAGCFNLNYKKTLVDVSRRGLYNVSRENPIFK
jgi:hypothetical protein